jgi:hypothetical protein
MTGLALPTPKADPNERQAQLLSLVRDHIAKLDPGLSAHEISYVRVIRGPAPSILEVECALVAG